MNKIKEHLRIEKLHFGFRLKLGLWLGISVILSAIFFQGFWRELPGMLSPSRIIGQNQVSPWGVLFLCFLVLILKWKKIASEMRNATALVYVLSGIAVTITGILAPFPPEYQLFKVLLVWIGLFAVFFGKAFLFPGVLLAIYCFAISFPLLVQRFTGDLYSQTAIVPVKWLLTILGYPFSTEGQWFYLTDIKGNLISVVVTVACAGPSTMAVFLAIFALMMLDMPLKPKRASWLLLFGMAGTLMQNIIRLALLLILGYYMGEKALWAAHTWSIYLLFPLWYLVFAYIYFRQYENHKNLQSKVAA